MKIDEILFENGPVAPQPDSLKVKVSSYDFNNLMKEFRAETDVRAKGDSGLVMFYSDLEREEFKNFLKQRGIGFENIETEHKQHNGENNVSPIANKKPNRYGV